jgi:hypothetical protein
LRRFHLAGTFAAVLAIAATGAAAAGTEPLVTQLTPCVLLAGPLAAEPARAPSAAVAHPGPRWGRWLAAEALAAGISSIGFADGGGRVKAGIYAGGLVLVTRDLFEGTPPTPTRGHVATIVGLAALAVADVAMERDGVSRGTLVGVNFAALNAIAFAARAGRGEGAR